jgi:hypothetical protein
MAKNRRKKNLSERKRDIADRDESFAQLYEACNKFFDEFGVYEGDYGEIGVMYYDQLRKHYHSASWVSKRLKEDYVADDLQGCWETTTHSHFYKCSEAA